jgi:hypothetical protein
MNVEWNDWGWRGKCDKHELAAWSDGKWHVSVRNETGFYTGDTRGHAEPSIRAAKQAAEAALKALLVRERLGKEQRP